MDFADVSLVALRVFREVAERGTLTSAAAALGYTQSAVSRQVASLERAAGAPLLERRHDGVRPTTAGYVVLRHAATVLDQIDTAARELIRPAREAEHRSAWAGTPARAPTCCPAPSLPRNAAPIPPYRHHPGRQHPRAGPRATGRSSVDMALLALSAAVPPTRRGDTPLDLQVLAERTSCASRSPPPSRSPARTQSTSQTLRRGQRWIASPSSADETLMGVWPGLDLTTKITHHRRDWMTKLHLVAAGCADRAASFAAIAPPGVRVLAVRGGSQEQRRVILARLPHPRSPSRPPRLADALRAAAADVPAPS